MSRAGLAAAVITAILVTPSTSVAAAQTRDDAPPPLPAVVSGACIGESPVVIRKPPWAQVRLHAEAVWPVTRGAGVTVAVLDTGVSAAAEGLLGAVRSGVDVVSAGPADSDCIGRGTALAGIIAARAVTGSAFVGVAPAATILPIRIVDGKGKVAPGALASGIRAATSAGADVILLGVGTPAPDADLMTAVLEAAARDIVLVASVSDHPQASTGQEAPPWYPAYDEQVLAVAGIGVDGLPAQQSPASASVDLVAPAAGAVSIAPAGNGNFSLGGPAVAAAFVAGAAALVRAYHPQLGQAEVRRRTLC
jgi:hypothetical protein